MKVSLLGSSLASLLLITSHAYASSGASSSSLVNLDYGSFQGAQQGKLLKFLGMPFAAPPVGNLRFAPPQPPHKIQSIHNATSYGTACPQQAAVFSLPSNLSLPESVSAVFSSAPNIATSEDCLFINVIKPESVKSNKKLPVVFWIFGGGFELGDTSYSQGDSVVNRSIDLNEPVIYVSANYRVNAFGFLGGKEALENGAANAGLKDQRFALKWVQKYIHLFGGDPNKVTLWGQSAGSYSVALQLVINNGNNEGLFRAAVMESGSTSPLVSPTTSQQPVYDQLVSDTGCSESNDTFACLRSVPFDSLMAAVNNTPTLYSYYGLNLFYQPSVDGEFIARGPAHSVQQGFYSKVPVICGDVDDEGTFFAIASVNVTTDDQFGTFVSTALLPGITDEQLNAITDAYPSDITQGSPFDTGSNNAESPQFKRIAALQGDLFFQAPRRFFMHSASKTQPTYGYVYKRSKNTSFIGSYHGSELGEFYGLGGDFIAVDALINFVNTLDPNSPKNKNSPLSSIHWPRYTTGSPSLLTFLDPAPAVNITQDTYRASAFDVLTNVSMAIFPRLQRLESLILG